MQDELLVKLFYAAQGDITQFRIKARALLEQSIADTARANLDLLLGVSVDDAVAAICVQQPHRDGSSTVIYLGKHPAGDSMAHIKTIAATRAN